MGQKRLVPVEIWANLSDDDLLELRICDLGLRIEGTVLQERIARLYNELDSRRIVCHPPCYLADEWLCPDRVPVVGIPFYLAHPRLTQLERKMMLEAEGGTDAWCMKLLRHEAGHALNYAYRFFARTRWRVLFGAFTAPYSSVYTSQPYSKRYVVHLEDNYAQAHPDEDFAETFAVWLSMPKEKWEEKYREWSALKKLYYVDHLMAETGSRLPAVTTRDMPWAALRMRSTLAAYYERKRRFMGDDFPGFYDPGLQRIFTARVGGEHPVSAYRFIRSHRRQIVNSVAMWTGERKFDIDKLVRKLAMRCDAQQLFLHKSEIETMSEVASFVTVVMGKMHRFIVDKESRRQ